MKNNARTHSVFEEYRHITQRISEYQQLELEELEHTEYNMMDLEQDIDPDSNFLSTTNNNYCY